MAADFYVIPPNSHLELMHQGDRYFCLAQIYHTNEEYRNFFKARVAEGEWVTLDNGAGDHALITEDILFECMIDLMPSEVIPPDVLFDKDQTLSNLDSFLKRMGENNLLGKIEIFACPQGKDLTDWIECYTVMLNHPYVKTIGMSKLAIPHAWLGKTSTDQGIKEARNQAFFFLREKNLLKKPLHFLGMGDPTEFDFYKGEPMVRSTDSCNTCWSAMNKFDWTSAEFTRIKTPHDYFERVMTEEDKALAQSNMEWFRDRLAKV